MQIGEKMKAFEEWWNKIQDDSCYLYEGNAENAAEESWKAALEWVLSRTNYHYGDELSNADFILDIEDELKTE